MHKRMLFLLLALITTSCSSGGGGSPPIDTTVSVNSLDGASRVALDSTFKHTFAGAVKSSTATASSYFILPTPAAAASVSKRTVDSTICNTANALPASISCSSTECVLDPTSNLDAGTNYTICLTSDIHYSSGTAFEGFMAQFTTGSCATGERAVFFTNSTGQTVWVGIAAGTISCNSDAECPAQASGSCVGANPAAGVAGSCGCAGSASNCGTVSTCSTANNFCYWNLPTLTSSQINLANGAQSTICFPAAPSTGNIQWSGNIFARTGCNSSGQQCQTADCNAGTDGICPTGTGGNPPAALFEFTFSNQSSFPAPGPDYYDISIINGINVGVSAGPVSGTYAADSSNPYSCTTPGSSSAQGSLLACPWTITPTVSGTDRSTQLRDVLPSTFSGVGSCPNGGSPNSLGYCECATNADCTPGSLFCGFAMNASSGNQYTNVCGTHIGWWTADQLCGSSINVSPLGAPLNCASTVTNSDGSSSTYTNFFACTQPAGTSNPLQAQSCYTNGAATDCCGCATSGSNALAGDWPTAMSPGFGGSDNGCYNNNSNWATVVQPWLVYLKQACPTAYTYPFDDATSTFTCTGSASVGTPDYSITFLATN